MSEPRRCEGTVPAGPPLGAILTVLALCRAPGRSVFTGRYSRMSAGWQPTASSIAARVENRRALALSFFEAEMFAPVIPNLPKCSVTRICSLIFLDRLVETEIVDVILDRHHIRMQAIKFVRRFSAMAPSWVGTLAFPRVVASVVELTWWGGIRVIGDCGLGG